MTGFGVDARWLFTEALRIGCIVLVGFLLAHLLGEAVGAFGVEFLYGVRGTLMSVLEFTTLLTALLYTVAASDDATRVA